MRNLVLMCIMVAVTFWPGTYAVASDMSSMEYRISAGFNIGGTAPLGLPAEIRKIDSYHPTLNLAIGLDVTRMLSERWGIMAGLTLETKGMNTGIRAKNYHLTMNVISGDATGTRTGYYTGHIKNETKVSCLTIPVNAVFRPDGNWRVEGGAYFSYAFNRSFLGEVSEGHMREDPLHPVIAVNRADYNYSSDIRRLDVGLDMGCSRRIYKDLSVRALLSWGLLSTLNSSTRKIDMDTYNIYLNLGISYSF